MDNKKITFGVIIPAYENNKFLYEALLSVYKQKYKCSEVIIVDTSKKRINKSIIKKFNKDYKSNYKYFIFKNTYKEGKARNLASKKIKSEYLAFLDDDDYWHINYLKNIKDIIISKKKYYDIFFTQLNFVNIKNKILKKHIIPKHININDLYLYNPGTFTSNMVIKRDVFLKIGMFEENYGWNDKEILIKIIHNNFKYLIIKRFLVFRRIHFNQISMNYHEHLKDNIFFFKKYYKNLQTKLFFRFILKINFIFFKMIIKKIKVYFNEKLKRSLN